MILIVAGALAAAFVISAVDFADALILNAVWLHIKRLPLWPAAFYARNAFV